MAEIKTKEAVLSNVSDYPMDDPKFRAGNHKIITVRDALKAMDEYASQQVSAEATRSIELVRALEMIHRKLNGVNDTVTNDIMRIAKQALTNYKKQ